MNDEPIPVSSNPVDTAMIRELKRLSGDHRGYLGDQLGNAALRMQGLIEEIEQLKDETDGLRAAARHARKMRDAEIERLTRERDEAREHTSTAAFMRLEAERDEWARKWHRVRAELAELKYPGMKGIVRPLSDEPNSAPETSGDLSPPASSPFFTFIINGNETSFAVEMEKSFLETVASVLRATGNEHRPVEHWEVRTRDGMVLPMHRSPSYCSIQSGARLFLSPRVGYGGSSKKAGDGPGEEDGPWAEGWDKRSGRCTCEHADRYHFDDGTGFVRCRAAADCKCNWPTSAEITEHIERDKPARGRPASGEPTDAEKRAMGVDLDSCDHEAR